MTESTEVIEHASRRSTLADDAGLASAPGSWWRGWPLLETSAVFVTGVLLMNFIYIDARDWSGEQLGAPGYDSFYHIKMAAMLPEIGLVDEFPWLRFVYFTPDDHRFISHHVGFHVLLVPFVHLSQYMTGGYMAGGRWAISAFFGASLALVNLLLMSQRVPWRWMWLTVFLMLPADFFLRHSYVRAISPALMFLLLILLLLFQRRYVLAGVAVCLSNLLYLGAVIYSPVLVIAFVVASLLGSRGERSIEWKAALATLTGWFAGVLSYPYRDGMLDFLKLQVFGSGLSPDISVGREWQSYDNVWHFAARACGPLLIVWATALTLRLRMGPRLTNKDTTLLLLNFIFLALTLKAQRFIEYWPVFCLLSAAFLVGPVLRRAATWFEDLRRRRGEPQASWRRAGIAILFAAGAVWLACRRGADFRNMPMMTEWPVWTALALAFLLGPLCVIWLTRDEGARGGNIAWRRAAAVPLCGGVFVGLAYALFGYGVEVVIDERTPSGLGIGYIGLIVAAGLYVVVVALTARFGRGTAVGNGYITRVTQSVGTILATTGVLALMVTASGNRLVHAQRQVYCRYDMPAIHEVMDHLVRVSEPGDVVFTDDWDVFPVYFYYNSYNNYIVGLDPKFTQSREPELWARYVKVSRGEVPSKTSAMVRDESGTYVNKEIDARLEDIREHFGAKYVLVDRDHRDLARQLAGDSSFAELIYPSTSYKQSKDEPYLLFRVLDESEARPAVQRSGRTRRRGRRS